MMTLETNSAVSTVTAMLREAQEAPQVVASLLEGNAPLCLQLRVVFQYRLRLRLAPVAGQTVGT